MWPGVEFFAAAFHGILSKKMISGRDLTLSNILRREGSNLERIKGGLSTIANQYVQILLMSLRIKDVSGPDFQVAQNYRTVTRTFTHDSKD